MWDVIEGQRRYTESCRCLSAQNIPFTSSYTECTDMPPPLLFCATVCIWERNTTQNFLKIPKFCQKSEGIVSKGPAQLIVNLSAICPDRPETRSDVKTAAACHTGTGATECFLHTEGINHKCQRSVFRTATQYKFAILSSRSYFERFTIQWPRIASSIIIELGKHHWKNWQGYVTQTYRIG